MKWVRKCSANRCTTTYSCCWLPTLFTTRSRKQISYREKI